MKALRGPFPDVAEHAAAGARDDRRRPASSWLPRLGSAEAAKSSHSASVGSRAPAQRAKASASKKLTCATGAAQSISRRPAERELGPVVAPVERRGDALALDPGPAVATATELGVGIAAVGDELAPLAVGDRRLAIAWRLEQGAVARPFAVEGEAVAVGAPIFDDARRGPDASSAARRRSRRAAGSSP